MNATFYSGFEKRRNSTKRPSGGTTKSVALKEGTSLMHPEFIVTNASWSWNYASAWQYYYYVVDIIAESNNTFRVKCEIDVLASFKVAIGSYTTLISRADSMWDGEVMESMYPAKSNPYTLDASYSAAGIFTNNRSQGTVVMATVGARGQKFYIMSKAQFDALCYVLFPSLGVSITQWFTSTTQEALVGGLNTILEGITLLKWLPIDITVAQSQLGLTSASSVWIGALEVTAPSGAAVYELTGSMVITLAWRQLTFPDRNYTGITHRGDWLNMQPFAFYSVNIPPFGLIQIDGAYLVASQMTIQAEIRVDILSGNAILNLLYTAAGSSVAKTIGVYNANIACDIKAGGASYNIGGVVSGVASAALSYVRKDFAGVAGSIASSAGSLIPQAAQTGGGVSGSVPNLTSPWYIEATYFDPIEENKTELGRPLGKVVQISSLSGFVQCADAHCPLMGHEEEMIKVNEFLNAGFFYE